MNKIIKLLFITSLAITLIFGSRQSMPSGIDEKCEGPDCVVVGF